MTKSWDTYRSIIIDLYADRTLAEVRQIMQRDYGFDASTRAYRGRLIRWGVRKYNTRRADGSVSGDEDGDGGSSLSDAESPSPARQQRSRGHESQGRHRHQSDRHSRGRDDGQDDTSYSQPSPSMYGSAHHNGDETHLPYLYTSGYPQVSRSSSEEDYSVWNAPDNSPFSPSHAQAPSYSSPFYPSHSPVFSPYDGSFFDPHHSPVSGSGYDASTFSSFGSLGDGHGTDYGGHHQQYAQYPSSSRQHSQSAGGSRRGHRDRGRG